MCVKTSIINRRLPLVARITVGTTEGAPALEEKLFARYSLVGEEQKFAFIETSLPKAVLFGVDTKGLVSFNMKVGKTAHGILDDGKGNVFDLPDKNIITKVPLTGEFKMDAFVDRFKGWVWEQIPEKLPIAIVKATKRARSPYYALLLI